jgi:hypothetical protein
MFPPTDSAKGVVDMFQRTDILKRRSFCPREPSGDGKLFNLLKSFLGNIPLEAFYLKN